MSKQHDVFLSYSRKDQKVMEQVRDALRAQDIRVWTDESLEPGTPVWERSIEQAIRDSQSLLVLLSPDAHESTWVRSELRLASDKKLTIFPVLIRGEESSDIVPLGVYASQWIDARNELDSSKIVGAVQKKLGIEPKQATSPQKPRKPRTKKEKKPDEFFVESSQPMLDKSPEPSVESITSQKSIVPSSNQHYRSLFQEQGLEQKKPETTVSLSPKEGKVASKPETNTNSNTDSTWYVWVFSIIGALVGGVITFSPNLAELVQVFGGEMSNTIPQIFGYGFLGICIFSLIFGRVEAGTDGSVWLGLLVFAPLWTYVLSGVLPDNWLGLWTGVLIFLLLGGFFWLALDERRFENHLIFSVWSGLMIGLVIIFFWNVYGILVQILSNTFSDPNTLTTISALLTCLLPTVIILALSFIFYLVNGSNDLPVGWLLLIMIVSLGILVYIYQFGGWVFFAPSLTDLHQ